MTVLGGNPTIAIAGLFTTFTFTWMLKSRLRPRLFKIEHVLNWRLERHCEKIIGSPPLTPGTACLQTSGALHLTGYGVKQELAPLAGVERRVSPSAFDLGEGFGP